MRFLRDAIITVVLLLVVGAAIAYTVVARGGLSAVDQPGRVERTLARRLVRLAMPPGALSLVNPHGADVAALTEAAAHFEDHCGICHGEDGRGDTEIGKNMYPKVPDLASADIQHLSDGELFYAIQNGIRWTGMPGWKREHSEEDTWKLVSFIRRLPTLSEPERQTLGTTGQADAEPGDVHAHGAADHHHHHRHPH